MTVRDILDFQHWDWANIFYNLVAAAIAALIALWLGLFKKIRNFYNRYFGIHRYRRKLRENCSHLIVIGRKQGFAMQDVFVELDLATSQLSQKPSDEVHPRESFVLLGGPGAGKSTMVRKMVIRRIERSSFLTPFFLRLREYDGEQPLDATLTDILSSYNIPDSRSFVHDRLRSAGGFCVLDGLDEVRPHLYKKVCDQINAFYHRFFERGQGQLIVTCRKEAYRAAPLDIPQVCEVRPLSDKQLARFARNWPLRFPEGKTPKTFLKDLERAPRILELARSPLLLVGGLMQYTESNLGVPEERAQYLDRIAKWLLFDWATAQGHPQDPYKPAYEKLLIKLAFHMHKAELSECSHQKLLELFRGWLPMFGFQAKDAEAVIESISSKTGILVRDVPGCAVFAQFGLQEYFASRAALKELGPVGLAEASLKPWWREAVLLSTAQEQTRHRHSRRFLKPTLWSPRTALRNAARHRLKCNNSLLMCA